MDPASKASRDLSALSTFNLKDDLGFILQVMQSMLLTWQMSVSAKRLADKVLEQPC